MKNCDKKISELQKKIEFLETAKAIAKLIETQYDESYIIPLIGEMIDKFLFNHLVYIFLKTENNTFELAWPGACNDARIYEYAQNWETPEDKKLGIFPIVNYKGTIGVLITKSIDEVLSEVEIDYIKQLTAQAAATLGCASDYLKTQEYASHDILTGFYNRRELDERIRQETSSSRRQNYSLCAIMCDIDHFKNVNDTYGHAAGDQVLRTVAQIIRTQLREYDTAGRYGGEEFAVLLPFTKIDEAAMAAERLRKAVESKDIKISHDKNINVTISLGVYEFKLNDSENDLLNNADKALYKAKETGRNKVIIYKEK